MFYCAQLDEQGVCRTLAMLAGVVEGQNIIPLDDGQDVLGWKYGDGQFYRLVVTSPNATAVNQPVSLSVSWRDQTGQLVSDDDQVTAICGETEIPVEMVDGMGQFDFTSEVPGVCRIEIRAQSGVSATVEVTVSE